MIDMSQLNISSRSRQTGPHPVPQFATHELLNILHSY